MTEIPICGEGDTPVLVAQRVGGRWQVAGVNGVAVRTGLGPTFATSEAAIAFAREWYEDIGDECKRLLLLPHECRQGRGEKIRDAAKKKQRMKFIAARHGGVFR